MKELNQSMMQYRRSFRELERRIDRERTLSIENSVKPSYSALLNSLKPGNLVVISSRPAHGKTALALQLAKDFIYNTNKPTAFFSLELFSEDIAKRLLILESKISKTSDEYTKEELNKMRMIISQLLHLPFYIDDSTDTCPHLIKEKCIPLHEKRRLGLIVVDYLQLMHSDSSHDQRSEEVGQNLRDLKRIARLFNCAVIVTTQLNRGMEDFEEKRLCPEKGDVVYRHAQSDSDLFLTLYRDFNENSEAKFTIVKNRHGEAGSFEMFFNKESLSFQSSMK